ncbi:MAG: hypothetical protein RL120_06245 [Gammaproteobacteria bacterium]
MKTLWKLFVGCSVALFVSPLLAQQDPGYLVQRTAEGHPDLQGVWTNDTITPMERPAALADKAFLTADEIAALEARTAANRERADNNIEVEPGGNVGGYNQIWLDSGDTVLSTGQTSLIVDPTNGRAPLREEAAQIRDFFFANVENDYIYHTVWDRCITRGVPGSMLPAGYNNAYRIIQTPGYVTIVYEMIHDVRIIPLQKSAPVDERIRLWMGDSVAHWDGDTLVVETTNFNDRGMIANSTAGARLKAVPAGEKLHVVERFTRVSADTIIWDATITEPDSFTRPFTISMPLTRDDQYVMYEYACHEGNHAISNILSAGRARERREAASN